MKVDLVICKLALGPFDLYQTQLTGPAAQKVRHPIAHSSEGKNQPAALPEGLDYFRMIAVDLAGTAHKKDYHTM